ncbi:MAG: TonB-dependent receptor plug domain-containing protein [Cyclobacteriaceae bacterium]|nr:TonB-dependent receptor plug domain-containing protein [Cyclobacteriaceae bacterium]
MDRLKNKSYRPLLLLMALFYVPGLSVCFAQEQITQLNEVEITAAAIKKFGVGATISTIDSAFIQSTKQLSLAQLLSMQSSVYIKLYGAGMLSTISFRGTGASQTSVLWNGMQVGYPFLGQADLSLIPLDFVDEINLVHGSSSARFGTGAIGGVIDLKSGMPARGIGVAINQSVGSFGTTNSTVQLSKSGEKGYLKIGGYYKQSENNFPYNSSKGTPLGNQKNANFSVWGVQLASQYNLAKNKLLVLEVQATNADRNLQPSIGSSANNNQKDKNLWSSLKFQHLLNSGLVSVQYGFLFDEINYEGSITTSNQHKTTALFEYDILANLSTEIGVNNSFIEVKTPFYENEFAQENRTNLFASILWLPVNRLNISLNLRQAFVTGYAIPFTPSLGLDFQAFKSLAWQLNFKGQLAKGYNVPTLNDRFWIPGGNLNLLPEESVNAEVGFDLKNKGNTPFWVRGTTYQLWVDNWILWMPNGAIWSPENKRKVKGFGVELETGLEKELGKIHLKGWLNYAYTKSTNQEALDEYDRSVGKQLPYVPFHNGNITGQARVGKWSLSANAVVTGKRFITGDNETEVPGFALLNLQGSYQFLIQHWSVTAYLDANNITNTNYQSIINRAMPGINFLAGIKINFNK